MVKLPCQNFRVITINFQESAFLGFLRYCFSLGKCQQPSEQGNGQDYSVRWFYNGSICTRFWYGGSNGNDNNFETEEECQRECPGYFSEGMVSHIMPFQL